MQVWITEFEDALERLGIKKGDLLYISSDITMLMYTMSKKYGVKGKEGKNSFLNTFVDILKKAVGEEGTLLIPMFTWSFCRGIPYDVKTTKGEVGVFGNWVLENRTDFKRTAHPLYSFMVWGKEADTLLAMNNRTAWGQDSPFAFLHHNHGKNLLFNVSLERCFTFTHYVEETIRVPYRYFKDFKGSYVDVNGQTSERVYTMYVRDLDIESKQVTPDECLDKAGVAKKIEIDGSLLRVVDLEKAFPVVEENYRLHNGDEWYDFGGYQIDFSVGQTHPNETTMEV